MTIEQRDVRIEARDSFPLAATLFGTPGPSARVVIINAATATPRRFYRSFAEALAEAGYVVVTYDYRGVAGSKPESLAGFVATMRDWALLDMAGVVDWVSSELAPAKIFLVGHSLGGQVAGMLDNAGAVAGMLTFSSQSGFWLHQGAEQKAVVAFHVYLTLPILSRLFGYMPWGRLAGGEDIPKAAALEWASWCRNPHYLLGDSTLPLERYADFAAPVLAYSFGDDKWGTPKAVDAMMRAYPNLERRHFEPADAGLEAIGHFGFFKPAARVLWDDAIAWLDAQSSQPSSQKSSITSPNIDTARP